MRRALLAMLVLAACTQPRTQLVPVVSSDLSAAQIQCVLAEAARITPGQPFTPIDTPHLFYVNRAGNPQADLPFSFGLLPPGDDASARIEVRVSALSACDDADPSVRTVTRVVRTGFVRGQRLALPIFLSTRCAGVVCADGTTCEDGACVAVADVGPATLATIAHPGDELDGARGMDAGTPGVDTGVTPVDTGVSTDVGAPRDTAIPDAGAACGTVATMVGSFGHGGTFNAFALGASLDGTLGLRGLVLRGTGSDWAGAMNLAGASQGSSYSPPPGSSSGPVGVGFLADNSARMVVFGMGGIIASPLFTFSMDPNLGGACPSSRCVVGVGTDFAVLRGPANLTLVQVHVAPLGSGARGTVGTSVAVASGTTGGGLRPAMVGALVSYAMGGMCFVEHWPDFVARSGRLPVPDCTGIDVAELTPGGSVGVAWTDSAFVVHAAVADAALTTLGSSVVVDGAQNARQPVEVGPSARGFRVSWVDDVATPLVRSVELDATGTQLTNDCAAVPGHLLADYRSFHAVRRGASSAVEWPQGTSFFGATFPD